ncbi:cryptochrome/photolyase family protein, partial [cf. Phormidesmis sp. LEGE 11477]|uniref:cryptochrome/photolyase family protein n=1 Tax=cf. Phormidesmis sp. LEGE 11477 TaxID=1828680 RepID=UPI0018818487
MTVGVWVLGDQLWQGQSAIASRETKKSKTPIILIESRDYIKERRYHQQKLILIWSAMRHFAKELEAEGWQVTYEIASDFETPLEIWIEQNDIDELRIMEPADRPFADRLNALSLN